MRGNLHLAFGASANAVANINASITTATGNSASVATRYTHAAYDRIGMAFRKPRAIAT